MRERQGHVPREILPGLVTGWSTLHDFRFQALPDRRVGNEHIVQCLGEPIVDRAQRIVPVLPDIDIDR